ncbi:MAG: hypothetical protein ACE5JU_17830 [Candidatus Binatia bacterium]
MPKKFTPTKHKVEVKTTACIDTIYLALVLVLFLFVADAHAYIDPGTGSYILQLTIAGLLGAAYVLKVYWRKALDFIRNVFLKSKKDNIEL